MNKFLILKSNEMLMVDAEDILYFETLGNHSCICYMRNGVTRRAVVKENLKSLEGSLEEYDFLRVHRSFIAAVNHIAEIKDGWIFLDNAEESRIPLGGTSVGAIGRALKERASQVLD